MTFTLNSATLDQISRERKQLLQTWPSQSRGASAARSPRINMDDIIKPGRKLRKEAENEKKVILAQAELGMIKRQQQI